jgi:hypothetical protein
MPVQSRVTPFFERQVDFKNKTFFVVTGKTRENESLELRSYAGMISKELQSKGMVQAKDELEANFVVVFSNAIDDGKSETTAMPVYTPGQTYTSTTYGSATAYGSTGSVSAYGTSTTYGQTSGSTTYVPISNTVYTRILNVRFYALLDGKRQPVYEVRAISRGSSGSFSEVAQAVIAAAFDELPFSVSGKTVRIEKMITN